MTEDEAEEDDYYSDELNKEKLILYKKFTLKKYYLCIKHNKKEKRSFL
jgi:hypothetical protein